MNQSASKPLNFPVFLFFTSLNSSVNSRQSLDRRWKDTLSLSRQWAKANRNMYTLPPLCQHELITADSSNTSHKLLASSCLWKHILQPGVLRYPLGLHPPAKPPLSLLLSEITEEVRKMKLLIAPLIFVRRYDKTSDQRGVIRKLNSSIHPWQSLAAKLAVTPRQELDLAVCWIW